MLTQSQSPYQDSGLREKTSILSLLEADHDATVIAEVTLIVVAPSESVAEPGQHKIKLCWPDGNVFGQGDIETSTNHKIPRIVARVVLAAARTASARSAAARSSLEVMALATSASKQGTAPRPDEGTTQE